jgi:hypothetical protein
MSKIVPAFVLVEAIRMSLGTIRTDSHCEVFSNSRWFVAILTEGKR